MAYIQGSEKEKRDKQIRETGQPSGSAPVSSTSAPTPGTVPNSKSGPTGSFAGIQRYLTANQDQAGKLSEKIAGNINQGLETGKNELKSLADNTYNEVAKSNVTFRPDVIKYGTAVQGRTDQASKNLAKEYDKYTSTLNEGYKGPNALDGNKQFQVQSKLTDAQKKANMTANETSRAELLKEQFAKPTYNTGQVNLDQLLVQNDPNSRTRFEAIRKLADDSVANDVAAANARIKTAADQQKLGYQYAQQQVAKAQGKPVVDELTKPMGIAPVSQPNTNQVDPNFLQSAETINEQAKLDPGFLNEATQVDSRVQLENKSPELLNQIQIGNYWLDTANQFLSQRTRSGMAFKLPNGKTVGDLQADLGISIDPNTLRAVGGPGATTIPDHLLYQIQDGASKKVEGAKAELAPLNSTQEAKPTVLTNGVSDIQERVKKSNEMLNTVWKQAANAFADGVLKPSENPQLYQALTGLDPNDPNSKELPLPNGFDASRFSQPPSQITVNDFNQLKPVDPAVEQFTKEMNQQIADTDSTIKGLQKSFTENNNQLSKVIEGLNYNSKELEQATQQLPNYKKNYDYFAGPYVAERVKRFGEAERPYAVKDAQDKMAEITAKMQEYEARRSAAENNIYNMKQERAKIEAQESQYKAQLDAAQKQYNDYKTTLDKILGK